MWKSVKNWPQEWVFNIYKRKWGRSRWIAYFENFLQKWFGDRYGEFPTAFPTEFPTRFSRKNFPQDLPQNFLQDFSARIFRKIIPQEFPTRFFRKIFHQDLPQNFLQEFPARFSLKICHRISCKIFLQHLPQNFPQDFPARISHKIFPQDFPELDPNWLAPHHPIPNAKFPPITALLNRPTYHKRSKVYPPPFPQILWEPQVNE